MLVRLLVLASIIGIKLIMSDIFFLITENYYRNSLTGFWGFGVDLVSILVLNLVLNSVLSLC